MNAARDFLAPVFAQYPLEVSSGEGVWLHTASGRRVLDLYGGHAVAALGYGHPGWTRALAEQAQTLNFQSNAVPLEVRARAAARLIEFSRLDFNSVFFVNSGAEANENALKMAFTITGRSEVVALEHSFHGRTMGSVATTHKEKYRTPFNPVMPGVEFVRFNDVEDLRAHFSDDVCGICIEAIQGEGGIHPVTQEFFAAARELCDSTGALLIADEIQCGFGRTGKWFGYQHFEIVPDVVTIAKPLAGGLPIGAMLCTERVAAAITPGMHGTTFGGGPLVCAVAIAVIDEMKRTNLLEHVTEVGGYFMDELRGLATEHGCITEVRGAGLMVGMELDSTELAKTVAAEMLDQRIILNRTSENVLRFLPPYILERQHVDTTVAALDAILTSNASYAGQAASGDHAHG